MIGGGQVSLSEIERDRGRQQEGERVWLQSRLNTWRLIWGNMMEIKKTMRGILFLVSSLLLSFLLISSLLLSFFLISSLLLSSLQFGLFVWWWSESSFVLLLQHKSQLWASVRDLQGLKVCFIIVVAKQLKLWEHLWSYLISFGGGLRDLLSRQILDGSVSCGCVCCGFRQQDVNIKPPPASGVLDWLGNLLPDDDAMWYSRSSTQLFGHTVCLLTMLLWDKPSGITTNKTNWLRHGSKSVIFLIQQSVCVNLFSELEGLKISIDVRWNGWESCCHLRMKLQLMLFISKKSLSARTAAECAARLCQKWSEPQNSLPLKLKVHNLKKACTTKLSEMT